MEQQRLGAPSKKKIPFIIQSAFSIYLQDYGRAKRLPVHYEDLLDYETALPLYDKKGNDTLWKSVYYSDNTTDRIYDALRRIYAILQADGDSEMLAMEHLSVARIDFCSFGNTKPFRVRIINHFNDNYDHFYVKRADASRVYGLELEDILSPNRISYLVDQNTLIEEHIAGIPGDLFIQQHLNDSDFNQIRIAKEFVKFNERCFVRLLGDMRSYNFVVDITPDFEATQFRIRAIDFDQQSYEGMKNLYMPQFYKENRDLVKLVMKYMNLKTIKQYRIEERNRIGMRVRTSKYQLQDLLCVITADRISFPEKVEHLRHELALHYHNPAFEKCNSMGEILRQSLQELSESAI